MQIVKKNNWFYCYQNLLLIKKYWFILALEMGYFFYGVFFEADQFYLLINANLMFLWTPILFFIIKRSWTISNNNLDSKKWLFIKLFFWNIIKLMIYLLPIFFYLILKKNFEVNFLNKFYLIINFIPITIFLIISEMN